MFKKLAASTCAIAILVSGSVSAQVNLTAETASLGGATHLSPAHLTEIAGTKGIAVCPWSRPGVGMNLAEKLARRAGRLATSSSK